MITPDALTASERLSELSACAYRLGTKFGAEAERAETPERELACFELFERCFFAVRVATALQLRLWQTPAAARDAGAARADRPDAALDRGLARDRDFDRDREREPASLPLLLKTLDAVAEDAAALAGPAPAKLPTLRELLAQLKADPAPAMPPTGPGLRARLAGSAPAPLVTVPPPTRPSPILALHRATGPPRG